MAVLSIQIPGPCPLACGFCRSPEHEAGDPERVVAETWRLLAANRYTEVYLTGTGEPGMSPTFDDILTAAREYNIPVAVLGTSESSVHVGMSRAEISWNKFTKPLAEKALALAKKLGVPTILSVVDTGKGVMDLGTLANKFGADGVLVRALQPEGRSKVTRGITKWWVRPGAQLGEFPVAAYRELEGLGNPTDCLNAFGNLVPVF